MALMRLFLLALLLGSWAPIASACADEQAAQPTAHAGPHAQIPVPCERMTLWHEPLTCECPSAVVGLHAAPESNKFVSLGEAGVAWPVSLRALNCAEGHDVRDLSAVPPSRSLYLMTARLRL